MREIKFRVWNGIEMVHDVVVGRLGAFYASRISPTDSACIDTTTIYPKECPVMQFTGLLDKLNKEIYEGDIIKSGNGRNWEIKHGEWTLTYPRDSFECYGWYMEGLGCKLGIAHAKSYEIIGNIYENPELIKPS